MGSQFRPSPLNEAQPPVFGSCLLWPNCWMDEDDTWYGSRPLPRPHCVRRGPSAVPTRKVHCSPPPLFGHAYLFLIWVLNRNACMKRFKTLIICENAWFKLGLTLTIGHYRCYIWQVAWPSEIMCACWGANFEHMFWYECSFIWFTRTFYEAVNVMLIYVAAILQ